MSWVKGLLIALGVVAVLVFAIIAGLGMLGSGGGKEVRHISMGQRTITVSHYKNLTQETTADGVRIMVDGHTIVATNDAITIDGTAQTFDPTQDVEITVDESGAVQAKTLAADAPRPGRRRRSSRGEWRPTLRRRLNKWRAEPLGGGGARHLAEQRRPGFLRLAREAGLQATARASTPRRAGRRRNGLA